MSILSTAEAYIAHKMGSSDHSFRPMGGIKRMATWTPVVRTYTTSGTTMPCEHVLKWFRIHQLCTP